VWLSVGLRLTFSLSSSPFPLVPLSLRRRDPNASSFASGDIFGNNQQQQGYQQQGGRGQQQQPQQQQGRGQPQQQQQQQAPVRATAPRSSGNIISWQ
jgi:hypothetical protein